MENLINVLMPVPESAPEPDTRHFKHGLPSASHAYRDANGELLFYVCRYDLADGAKQFMPFVCVQYADGTLGWAQKAPDAPRPLYGLDALAANETGRVLLVEGEKAADAARLRFPHLAVLTWANGANSVDKSDFTVLSERDVVLWSDNDDPGRQAMRKIAAKLEACAKSVSFVDVPPSWPKGWDLADALPLTVTEQEIRKLIDDAKPAASEWTAPDLSVLQERRIAPPAFPLAVLGPWLNEVTNTAEAKGVPEDYVALPLFVAAASLIGNARSVSPWPGWIEPCILWGACVGDPSSGKSPAADPVLAAIHHIEKQQASDFDERYRQWQSHAEAARIREEEWEKSVAKAVEEGTEPPARPENSVAPPEPKHPRCVVNDTTPEAVAAIVAGNPRGILSYRDELAGWLNSFVRYNGGNAQPFWIEGFGGRPYRVDRKQSAPLYIARLAVSVLGNIQPDHIRDLLMEGPQDGLSARFIFVWPDRRAPSRPAKAENVAFFKKALGKLASLPLVMDNGEPVPIVLMLEHGADDEFNQWRIAHAEKERFVSTNLANALGKMPGLVLRLALVLESLWWSATEDEVTPQAVSIKALQAAINLCDNYVMDMLTRVYGDAALPQVERNATTLARWITKNKPANINLRELRRTTGLPGLTEADDVSAAADELVAAGWLRPAPPTPGRGRKPGDYLVNPAILSKQFPLPKLPK
ncbi:MAG TPA: DUF3987 domain-containing protein [Xanthobacteraceae bacterium]|nr:DUF3987 domain-containing protein [Xanthobacteraceae bacterium]